MTPLRTRLSRLAARHVACNWLPLNRGPGVVSLCFDDVPASACQAGAALLEAYAGRASFYVCGSLTDQPEQGQLCHSLADLHSLAQRGHEIGCHTFSHTNCAQHEGAALARDWQANQDFFQRHGLSTSGFAFPFGAYDLGSKLAAARRFSYSRITGGGRHVGRADLAALRAQPLYAGSTDAAVLAQLIADTARDGGWLILYSHEVSATPGPWGTTPEQLELALHLAQQSCCKILSVQQAIDFFRA